MIDKDALMVMVDLLEKKLKEYMPPEEYTLFALEVSKQAFRATVEGWPEEVRQVVLDNFDEITGGPVS